MGGLIELHRAGEFNNMLDKSTIIFLSIMGFILILSLIYSLFFCEESKPIEEARNYIPYMTGEEINILYAMLDERKQNINK